MKLSFAAPKMGSTSPSAPGRKAEIAGLLRSLQRDAGNPQRAAKQVRRMARLATLLRKSEANMG